MKKSLFLLVIVTFLLTSCVTQKRCYEKFPPVTETIIKDSIITRDSIVEKIVEVPVEIKADTVLINDTVFIDKKTKLPNSKPVYAETDFAKATAQVVNGNLNLTLIQKDTLFNLQVTARESYFWKEKYFKERSKVVQKIKVIPKYYSIMSMIGLVSVVLLIAYTIFKIKSYLI